MPEPPPPPPFEGVTTVPTPGPGLPPGTPYPVFAPGQVLTAAQLNAALAAPTIIGGTINGTTIGLVNPQEGRFSTLRSIGAVQQDTGTSLFAGTGTFQVGDGNATKRAIFTSHYAPQAGTLNPLVLMQGNAFGTVSNNVALAAFRAFNINADAVNAAGAQGGGLTANFFGHTISAGAVGGRTTLGALLYHSGASTVPGSGNVFYVAMSAFSRSVASAGGTSGSVAGNLFGMNYGAYLQPGAGTYWHQVVGAEINVAIEAGTSAQDKVGLQIVEGAKDAVQAPGTDAALVIASQVAQQPIGWKHLFLIGAGHGSWPLNPAGTVFGVGEQNKALPARYPIVAANGIDFATIPIVFTGRALAVPGFSVDGTGQTTIGPNTIGWSSAGLSIGATGKVAALSSVYGGGSNYVVGDVLRDGYGGVWRVATLSGSAVATLTMHKAPTITSGAAPSNPLALTGGMGTLASINVTWADAGTIALTGTTKLDGPLIRKYQALTAAGTNQATAAAITGDIIYADGPSTNQGVRLPPATTALPRQITVIVSPSNDIKIYPAAGDEIGQNGTDQPMSVAIDAGATLVVATDGVWAWSPMYVAAP